jgi:hypothetical protein
MAPNQNPRESLAGWHLHPRCAWPVLVLTFLIPTASWLPGEWGMLRAVCLVLGCFAVGVLIANRGAIWQRTAATEPTVYPVTSPMPDSKADEPRAALIGWRIHPAAARILLVCAIGGLGGLAFVPKGWVVLREVCVVFGSFAAGALAARDAVIWQRAGDK